MNKKLTALICLLALGVLTGTASAQNETHEVATKPVQLLKHEREYSNVSFEPATLNGKPGLAVVFEGTNDLHYYAEKETAPTGLYLRITASAQGVVFGKTIFPEPAPFFDNALKKNIKVYVGDFTAFVPIESVEGTAPTLHASVTIAGIACTSMVCLKPFENSLHTHLDWADVASWKPITLQTKSAHTKTAAGPAYSLWFALLLSLAAGLSLNIMPCVWPVLPIIVMRLVDQAKQGKGKSITMGLAFCLGILLFFACLAGANIILQLVYGTVLQWGDQFRNPAFVTAMSLLLVVLALFMFGLFSISVPSGVTGKSSTAGGYPGSVGMGFFAAILSTPCSFAILAAAFAWAQAQHWLIGSIAIMVIGLGMALPYAILTSMPKLLQKLPKAGQWMELFKQAIGFVLLVIAVKLLIALPELRQKSVLYFSVILAFCIWMWGTWVQYGTPRAKKYTIRIIALALALLAGWRLLPAKPVLIDWQPYDSAAINAALEQKRPVLIKFTADWCFNCAAAERTVYSRKDIADLITRKNVLPIEADTTQKSVPATIDLENIYKEPAIPVSILLTPDAKDPIKMRGWLFTQALRTNLQKLPTKPRTNGQ